MTPLPTAVWFHCFSGISGDMALGSLLDAGADVDEVTAICERLPVSGWGLRTEPVMRAGIAATRAVVVARETSVVRTAAHISALVEEARLPDRVRIRALAVFDALARAEGRLHRRPPEQVHFHEVGAIDSIVDIVGTCAALEVLEVDEVHASPVAVGRGMVRSAHGHIPTPAPAVIELLTGASTYGVDIQHELTTPTGAAILAALAASFGPIPAMTIAASGFGAGEREHEHRPNLTQAVLGAVDAARAAGQPVTLLETNVDDVTGEMLAHAVAALLDAGAHDAWITPIVMKKGRPAHTVSALVDAALVDQVAETMLTETGSLGLRGQRLERWPEARRTETVDVEGRRVRVKVSAGRVKVEHDDAARAAEQTGLPVREVVSLAEESWRRRARRPRSASVESLSDRSDEPDAGERPDQDPDPSPERPSGGEPTPA